MEGTEKYYGLKKSLEVILLGGIFLFNFWINFEFPANKLFFKILSKYKRDFLEGKPVYCFLTSWKSVMLLNGWLFGNYFYLLSSGN